MIKVHEHTVEVVKRNDPLSSLLTESTLLRHLERYARRPHEYFEPMESSEVTEGFENNQHVLRRILHFGRMTVADKVTFVDNKTMVTDIDQTDDYPASRLTIKIETSAEQVLSLHFIYEEDSDTPPTDDIFLSLRRKAYEEKDRDMVERFKQQAQDLSELS